METHKLITTATSSKRNGGTRKEPKHLTFYYITLLFEPSEQE